MNCLRPLIHIKDPEISGICNKKTFISYKWFSSYELNLNQLLRDKKISAYPCGKCYHCVNNRRYQWVRKMELEKFEWKNSYMLTLTYDNEHLPKDNQLSVHDLQKFIKRFRKNLKIPFNYFATGEYGTRTERPHYHLILFTDRDFELTPLKKTKNGAIFKCKEISDIWKNGFVSIIHCNSNKAFVYCASYSNKAFLKQRLNKRNREFPIIVNDMWKELGSSFKSYALISDYISNHFNTQFKPEFYCFSKARPIGSRYKNLDLVPSSLIKYHYRHNIKNTCGFLSSFKSFDFDKCDILRYTRAIDKVAKTNEIYTMYEHENTIREFKTFKIMEKNLKEFTRYIETNDIQYTIDSASSELDAYNKKKLNSSTF